MKKLLSITILVLFIKTVYCQNKEVSIQYLKIKNDSFIKNVTDIIENEKNRIEEEQNLFKKGLGYVAVTVYDYNHGDTLLKYNVLPMLSNIGKDDDEIVYPLYYTFIDERPILIYLNSTKLIAQIRFDRKSKMLISKIVQPFLEKTKDVQLFDESGNKAFRDKHFRIDYFKFSGGKDFFLVNKTKSY